MTKTDIKTKPKQSAVNKPRKVMIGDVMVTLRPHPGKGTLSRSLIREIVESARRDMLSSQ
ncbi:MAG: hypothetical protein ACKVY0_25630 [Prosthecobacter sp.]|uniref:hypothetical protein n=1 Tax=Prosthecobacter sp. TaxID=1965333 RepID=UPI0038FD52A5